MARSDVVCGIDLGSTNMKVVGVDASGAVVFRMTATTPRLTNGLLSAPGVLATVEEMLLRLGSAGHRVLAACGTGVGEDGLLTGDGQTPLCDILPWYHPARTAVYRRTLASLPGVDDLPVATDPTRTIVGWRWAQQQEGTHSARSWVALTDWPAVVWSGRPFMSDTIAARTAAWMPWGGGWVPDRVIPTLGDLHLLPPVLAAGEIVGEFRSTALSRAGVLAPGAVVVAGGHDHPVGAWAIHQITPHAVVDSMGTAEVVIGRSPRPALARSTILDVAPDVRGSGTTVLSVLDLARNVEWAGNDPFVAREISRLLARSVEPGDDLFSDGFLPSSQGGPPPKYTADAPSGPRARAAAVLGALARLGERRVQAVAAAVGGATDVYATGGWSRSSGWMHIKEATSGRTFRRIGEPEVPAVAAALLAAQAVGWDVPFERPLQVS